MGIKTLNELIREHCGSLAAFFSIPATAFHGKRIAIDALGWFYSNLATVRKSVVCSTDLFLEDPNHLTIRIGLAKRLLEFIIGFLEFSITPVFVFDGEHPPEKFATKEERRQRREKEAKEIQDMLYQLRQCDPATHPPNLLTTLKKKMCNHNSLPRGEVDILRNLLVGIGIPVLQAKGDGESLCSQLCIKGLVAAVYSVDTDNLACGCPLTINSVENYRFEHGRRVPYYNCVRLDKVLEGFGFTFAQFLDLCILLGCDNNKATRSNIKGIGKVTAHKMIKQYGRIENIPNVNIVHLNHYRCRELFSHAPRGLCQVSQVSVGAVGPVEPKPFNPEDSLNSVDRLTQLLGGTTLEEINLLPPRDEESKSWDTLQLHIPEIKPNDSLDINIKALAGARKFLGAVGCDAYILKLTQYYPHIKCTDGYSPYYPLMPVNLQCYETEPPCPVLRIIDGVHGPSNPILRITPPPILRIIDGPPQIASIRIDDTPIAE